MGGGSMLEAFYPAVEASEDGDGSRPGSAMSPMNRTMTGARLLYSPRAVPSWQAGLGLTAGGAKPPPRKQGASARVKPASSVDKAVDRLTTDGFSAKKTLSPVRSQNARNSNSSCAQLNYSRVVVSCSGRNGGCSASAPRPSGSAMSSREASPSPERLSQAVAIRRVCRQVDRWCCRMSTGRGRGS